MNIHPVLQKLRAWYYNHTHLTTVRKATRFLKYAIAIIDCMCHILFVYEPLVWKALYLEASHDDVIKWKHFPRNWPLVWGIHWSPVNSPHKGQWRGVLMFCLICVWINDWVNNREAGDLRRNRAHYDVIIMTRGNTTRYRCVWFVISTIVTQ